MFKYEIELFWNNVIILVYFFFLVVVYDFNVYLFYDEFLFYVERYYKYIDFKEYKLSYRDGEY